MRILLVITGLGMGGAERLVTQLADQFVERGHEVEIVALTGSVEVRPRHDKIRIHALQMHKTPISTLSTLARLRRIVRQFKPDVVNGHMKHANFLTRLLRLTTPIPRLISSAHNTNEGGRLGMAFYYRLTDRLADASTNVSDESVQAFVEQGAVRSGRMLTIHNGIDTDVFVYSEQARHDLRQAWGVDDTTSVLLAIGRLEPQKDYPNLLRALSLLKGRGYLPKLYIVGTGPLQAQLETLAESLDVASQVTFLGRRHDIAELLSASDVFVLSSSWEGFSLVSAEAMACKRIVVATDSGGVNEVVGDSGMLVPPHDTNALANGLIWALALDSEERRRMGKQARNRVLSYYSIEATTTQYLEMYQGNN